MQLLVRESKTDLTGLLFWVAAALAQTETGSIGGFVKDSTGGLIPQAEITLKDEVPELSMRWPPIAPDSTSRRVCRLVCIR